MANKNDQINIKTNRKKYHLFAKPNTAILELYKTRKQNRSDQTHYKS